jgi:hypothetical protein
VHAAVLADGVEKLRGLGSGYSAVVEDKLVEF